MLNPEIIFTIKVQSSMFLLGEKLIESFKSKYLFSINSKPLSIQYLHHFK